MDASRPQSRTACGDSVSGREGFPRALSEGSPDSLEWVLAAVSHELKNPISAILGHADQAVEHGCSSEATQSIRVIQKQCEHVLSILEGVLDIARLDSGAFSRNDVEFEPGTLVEDVVQLFRPQATEKGVELSCDVSAAVVGTVIADPARLRQVLVNLVSNAIKFTEAGRVVVRVSKCGSDLCYEVEDTGIGITEEQQRDLFLPFRQAELTTQKRFGGSGLGLSISRGLVRAMGGDLDVASEPGKGSTFRALVPWITGHATLLASREGVAETSDSTKPRLQSVTARVLLAEDEPVNQRLLKTMLERGGAEVVSVSDGWKAYQAVLNFRRQGRPFDLVLMDLHMPGCDGTEAALAIRGGGDSVPIIALTATATKAEIDICYESGFNEVASKPISNADLLHLVQRWTTGQSFQQSA